MRSVQGLYNNIDTLCNDNNETTSHVSMRISDAPVLEWSAGTMHAVFSELGLKQLQSTIDDKLSNDSYMIFCPTIKDLFDANPQ